MLHAIELANRACKAATGYAVRMCEVVRRYAKEHRRDQPSSRPRNLRRLNLPIARPAPTPSFTSPPAPSEPMEHLLSNRKRKGDDSFLHMSRVKRQDHGNHKSSPWAEESWAQQLATKVDIKLEKTFGTHFKKWHRRRPHRKFYSLNHAKYQRPTSPKVVKPIRVSLRPYRPDYFEQVYNVPDFFDVAEESYTPRRLGVLGERRIDEEMQNAQEQSIGLEVDEEALRTSSFAFVQPKEQDDAQAVIDDKRLERIDIPEEQEEEDDTWDDDGELAYRKLLRGLPESFDEEGYKVPIDGTISPETQAWNKEHSRVLARQAVHDQQTPSKPPKYLLKCQLASSPASSTGNEIEAVSPKPSSTYPSSPDELALEDVIHGAQGTSIRDPIPSSPTAAIPKVENLNGDKLPGTPSKSPVHSPQTAIKDEASTIKVEDSEETEIQQTPAIDQPLLEIGNLSLETPKPKRTPKSGSLDTVKKRLHTRNQERLARILAEKNDYPLVPLSQTWDDRVRHAVNNGHGRFDANMFAKCVPWYSNDPSAGSLWLDDAVINDYVAMVGKHGSKDDRKEQVRSVTALSSFFFTKISAPNVKYETCAGMLKRAGIPGKKLLDCEKIFIPINRSYHWTIAVIEPNIPEGHSPKDHKRKITVYNSMGSAGGHQVANIIMAWIKYELGASFKEDEWVIDPAGQSPQQRNTDDCGVFSITTARQIMLKKYDDVNERYRESDIRDMRKRIVAELVNGGLLNKEDSEK